VHRVLRQAGIALHDIGGLVVSRGPGSFTGLRIGITLVKALAYGLGCPVASIPSLDVLAHSVVMPRCEVCTIVDARRNRLYAATFTPGSSGRLRQRMRETLLSVDELTACITRRTLFIGDGIATYGSLLTRRLGARAVLVPREYWWPRVDVLARLGAARWTRLARRDTRQLAPVYLHARTCTATPVVR